MDWGKSQKVMQGMGRGIYSLSPSAGDTGIEKADSFLWKRGETVLKMG